MQLTSTKEFTLFIMTISYASEIWPLVSNVKQLERLCVYITDNNSFTATRNRGKLLPATEVCSRSLQVDVYTYRTLASVRLILAGATVYKHRWPSSRLAVFLLQTSIRSCTADVLYRTTLLRLLVVKGSTSHSRCVWLPLDDMMVNEEPRLINGE